MLFHRTRRPDLAFDHMPERDLGESRHLLGHIGDLEGQLERRRQDEHLRVVQFDVHTLQGGQQEGGRLTGTRL